jgi:hypothetical protein
MATPTAILTHAYGRCGADNGTVTYSGGFPRVLTTFDVGTVSNVKATSNCTSGNLEQICEDLTVVEFENNLEMDEKNLIAIEPGKSYTITKTCTGINNFLALVCPWHSSGNGCSVKVGSVTYSGGHNNSPGCRMSSSVTNGTTVESLSTFNISVKCEDQYNGSMCSN